MIDSNRKKPKMAIPELVRLTSRIVTAYLGHQVLHASRVPDLIETVHESLAGLGRALEEQTALAPAVPIRKSVTPAYIVCLEDGRKLKMLKRHLRTRWDMTPEEYRIKWNLPPDYPMVAPNYAKKRSDLAVEIGLGTHGRRARGKAGRSRAA
jgi:predicted transcriptional regulator